MAKSRKPNVQSLALRAERLAGEPALLAAFSSAHLDDGLRTMALQSPEQLLGKFDVKLPEGLSVMFFEGHPGERPYPIGPEIFPTIRLTRCRTVWIRECKPRSPSEKGQPGLCEWKQQTFCFGFEIVPGKWFPPIA
jgi:hypothetical protein